MNKKIRSFSFAGCAWHMAFHLGVGETIQKQTNTENFSFFGASSGALTALLLVAKVPSRECMNFLLSSCQKTEHRKLGPIGKMTGLVHSALTELLPSHQEIDHNRLKISVTQALPLKNQLLPKGPIISKEEIIKIALASCYIPFYYERPVRIKSKIFVDGGLTDNLPFRDRIDTVTIAPYHKAKSHNIDIFPSLKPRYWHAVFPNKKALESLYADGQKAAAKFLARQNLAS